jgi:hypothetical protein
LWLIALSEIVPENIFSLDFCHHEEYFLKKIVKLGVVTINSNQPKAPNIVLSAIICLTVLPPDSGRHGRDERTLQVYSRQSDVNTVCSFLSVENHGVCTLLIQNQF